ncbi:MAG: hypothetical protein LBD23_08740 [Oscillospiraceae bacterium]|nr:hypothetical protein [Oscillospiraceae bacterium]
MGNKEIITDYETPLVLIKISEKRFLQETIDSGRIYMNTASFFREQAALGGNPMIYDIDEASQSRLVQMYLKLGKDGEYAKVFGDGVGNLAIKGNQCLYCMYGIHHKLDKINDETYKHIISKELIKSFISKDKNINDYAILLLEFPYNFLEKFNDILIERRLTGAKGFVKYDDHKYEYDVDISDERLAIEACYHKKSVYKDQNEYRLVVINKEDEPITDLFFGRLEKDDCRLIDIIENKDLEITVKIICRKKFDEFKAIVSVDEIVTNFI